jgi:hemerythrin-like domain-containing protein
MPLQVGQRPDHGFDEPLGLLSDCHRRIEYFLGVLIAITGCVDGGMLSRAERAHLEGALTYFTTAAPRHTADEAESLFPRLRAARNREALDALDAIQRLERDHDEANTHHQAVDRLVRRWLADGTLADSSVRALKASLERLKTLYEAHIAVEDHDVFPAAARLLSPIEIQQIGSEMAARRATPSRAARSRGARTSSEKSELRSEK